MFCLMHLYCNIHVTAKYIIKYSSLDQSCLQFYEMLVILKNFQNLRTLYVHDIFVGPCKNRYDPDIGSFDYDGDKITQK